MKNVFGSLREFITRHSQINWALADQAMVSGVNFLTGILLARYLGLQEFGVFTLAWMAIQFTISLQNALIISPMMSIGPKKVDGEVQAYFTAVLIQQAVFGLLCFMLVFIGVHLSSSMFPGWGIGELALPMALTTMLFQMQEFFRRIFFTRGQPVTSFVNDFVKYGGQIVVLLWIFTNNHGSVANSYWVILATSFAAMILGFFQMERPAPISASYLKENCLNQLKFSKWLAASVITRWVSRNMFLIAAGAILGSSAAGALKAAQNLLGGAHIMFMGLENVMPMRASRIYVKSGLKGLTRYLKKTAAFVSSATLIIALVFSVPAEFWLTLFYGDEYAAHAGLVRWYAVIYVVMALTLPLEIGLRTLEDTSHIFWAWGLVSLFSLAASASMVKWMGIDGAALGLLLSFAIQICVLIFGYIRSGKKYGRAQKTNV